MEIPIKIKKVKIEEEPEIPQELIDKAVEVAEKITRPELAAFWLECKSQESEEDFDLWLKFVQGSTHQELNNMIHELGNDGLEKFIKKFKK